MRSSFFEFNVAISGLFTAKNGLQVTSHNMANASIDGYSRQVALQRATIPLATNNGKGMVGTGSEVYGVGQIRDVYLDQKYWSQKSVLGGYNTKRTQLSLTEIVFNEVAGTGLNNAFNSFFERLSDLSTATHEQTFRTNVLQTSESVSQVINTVFQNIKKQQSDLNNELSTVVDIINSLGQQIASLNKQIYKSEQDGSSANDMRDSRALLIDKLSTYCNIEVSELDYSTPDMPGDKRCVILLNGYDFVSHFDAQTLEVVPRTTAEKRNPMDVEGLYDIRFKNTNLKFNIYHPNLNGELRGLIDVRDGNNGNNLTTYSTSNYKGLPYYMNKLNDLVRVFAKAMNEGVDKQGVPIPEVTGHRNGYDANGDKGLNLFIPVDVTGKPAYKDSNNNPIYYYLSNPANPNSKVYVEFFDSDGNPAADALGTPIVNNGTTIKKNDLSINYDALTCQNFAVNPDILSTPELLACSDRPTDVSGESNNNVILDFANVGSYKSLFKEGKLSDFIISITSELGIDVEQAVRFEKNYTDVTTMINNQRISVSGVDMSEESLTMVRLQQLYNAAAKLVNIIDKIYDTTINRLGSF